MPSRFRNAGKQRISFFSFQDIITSVTGILILITLMMTLDINPEEPQGEPVSTRDLEPRLDAVRQSIRELQDLKRQATGAPSERELQDQLHELEEKLRGLPSAGVDKLLALSIQHQRLAQTNALKQAECEQLERSQKEIQQKTSEAKQTTNSNVHFVLKGHTAFGKRLLVAVVKNNQVSVDRLDDPKSTRSFNGPSEFRAALSSWDGTKEYFVFVVRPSGISCFEDCKESAKSAGFDVGYEPLEEDIVFTLTPEGAQ